LATTSARCASASRCSTHQQFILIADLQGLTDNGSNPQKISHHILEVMADYLAVGIDPRLTTICLQSALPALAELSALYMNIVTVARVERNPTVKNEIAQRDSPARCRWAFLPIRLARRPISPPSRPSWCRWATISYR
jgi:tryptophanyl-tRNA synthetase